MTINEAIKIILNESAQRFPSNISYKEWEEAKDVIKSLIEIDENSEDCTWR